MIARLLVPLSLSAGLLHASSTDFIRQIQTLNGQTVICDIVVHNDKGEIISKPRSTTELPKSSARFHSTCSARSS